MTTDELVAGSAPKGLTLFTFHGVERTDDLETAIKAAYLHMIASENTLPDEEGAAVSLERQLQEGFPVSIRPVALTPAGREAHYVAAFEVHPTK